MILSANWVVPATLHAPLAPAHYGGSFGFEDGPSESATVGVLAGPGAGQAGDVGGRELVVLLRLEGAVGLRARVRLSSEAGGVVEEPQFSSISDHHIAALGDGGFASATCGEPVDRFGPGELPVRLSTAQIRTRNCCHLLQRRRCDRGTDAALFPTSGVSLSPASEHTAIKTS
eukprot:CAMPEP_0173362538 /NCGR_PEP_ID=MMETSP1144-20121109/21859_1 /TAXON_ID=483371 /ORGANISM="non described non described, Strain CCMP2298" /LENGTH=172 /DNA_ID=CAMNT_0014312335 /DNA_START=9 /DNA_END=523 /DNA_ORIENTATION=+